MLYKNLEIGGYIIIVGENILCVRPVVKNLYRQWLLFGVTAILQHQRPWQQQVFPQPKLEVLSKEEYKVRI